MYGIERTAWFRCSETMLSPWIFAFLQWNFGNKLFTYWIALW